MYFVEISLINPLQVYDEKNVLCLTKICKEARGQWRKSETEKQKYVEYYIKRDYKDTILILKMITHSLTHTHPKRYQSINTTM